MCLLFRCLDCKSCIWSSVVLLILSTDACLVQLINSPCPWTTAWCWQWLSLFTLICIVIVLSANKLHHQQCSSLLPQKSETNYCHRSHLFCHCLHSGKHSRQSYSNVLSVNSSHSDKYNGPVVFSLEDEALGWISWSFIMMMDDGLWWWYGQPKRDGEDDLVSAFKMSL